LDYVTDEAGTVVYGPATGPQDVTVTTTGSANVYVSADSSVTKTLTFAISCEASTTAVTFNVDMSQYGLADGDTVHVNGQFTGWCGSCGNDMSDEDGDGVYTITMDLDPGTYFWKFTVNAWEDQEQFNGTEVVDGCTAQNGDNIDRQIVVATEDMSVTYGWNTCEATAPVESFLSLQGILDIDVSGGVGKGVHLVATADIADLSVYGLGSANNQQGTDGQEFALSGSVTAGQHILVTNSAADATGADVFLDGYLGASEGFDLIINGAGGALQGNGNDAYELFLNETVVETYGVTGNVGDSSQSSDYSMDWAYKDSWAYKVDGVWTTGGNGCTEDSVTTCESNCPYPFVDCTEPASCEYTITLTDLYGDGWYSAAGAANHSVDVVVGGVTVIDDLGLDFADGTITDAVSFAVADGETVEVVFNDAGNWSGECGYIVSDNLGNVVATAEGAGGGGTDAGPTDIDPLTALCGVANEQINVTADPASAWVGYMTVFGLEADGTQGGYQFGSGWGVADLQTTLNVDTPNMVLEPNFNTYANAIADGSEGELGYWTNGAGSGNKFMEATTQIESTETYNGADLTFTGSVYENTLVDGYNAVFFIKCLDPDAGYSDMLNGVYVLPLEAGDFSVTVDGGMLPEGKLVQYGFTVYGANANAENAYHGRVVIGDAGLSVSEPVIELDMRIYPNPSNGSYVTIQTPVNGVKYVEVFDITGKRLINTSLSADTLDVSSISAGMYLVKVTIEGQSKTSKLIIR